MRRIIDEANIRIDKDMIDKCFEEFRYSIPDRKAFFDEHVFKRLKECNDKHIREFDDNMQLFYKSTESMSIDELAKIVKKFTKCCSNRIYEYEMILLKILEEDGK